MRRLLALLGAVVTTLALGAPAAGAPALRTDPVGDGSSGTVGDITAVHLRHTSTHVVVRVVARATAETLHLFVDTPRRAAWEFRASYSNEIEDGPQALVRDRAGALRCAPALSVSGTATRMVIPRSCLADPARVRVTARSYPNGQAEQVLIDKTAWTPFARRG